MQPPQLTFILHDAGETKALLPVMKRLEQTGVDYSILADATARELLVNDTHLAPLPQDILTLSHQNPFASKMAEHSLQQALQANCFVTGVVSDFQRRWVDTLASMHKTIVGYYDAFGFNRFKTGADTFANQLSVLITPSRDTTAFFKNRFPGLPVVDLGQPILESACNPNSTQLYALLGLNPFQPTLLFAGGYGPDSEKALAVFCQAVKNLSNINIVLSLHPKADGRLENQLIQQYGIADKIKIAPKSIETAQLIPGAAAVLTYDSSVGMQALFQGKKVLCVGSSGTNPFRQENNAEFDPMRQYQLAPRYVTAPDLWQGILGAVSGMPVSVENLSNTQHTLRSILGIPGQATENITRFLLGLILAQKSSVAA